MLEHQCGLSRFGDGELSLAYRNTGLPFQRMSDRIRSRLLEVLYTPSKKVLVCFNNDFMKNPYSTWIVDYQRSKKGYDELQSVKHEHDVGVLYRRKESEAYRHYFDLLSRETRRSLYGEATVFFLGLYYEEYLHDALESVVHGFHSLFAGKKILIACPQVPLIPPSFAELVSQGCLECAAGVDVYHLPARDAFNHYGKIKSDILKYSGMDLVMIQAGPTASILAYDLATKHDLQAYDVGSLNTTIDAIWRIHGRV